MDFESEESERAMTHLEQTEDARLTMQQECMATNRLAQKQAIITSSQRHDCAKLAGS
jgi:hypothetical protein